MPDVIISGFSSVSGYGENFAQMRQSIAQGKVISPAYWFKDKREEEMMRLMVNPYYLPAKSDVNSNFENLSRIMNEALEMANLTKKDLQGRRVRVYLVGNGVRSDSRDYLTYLDRNDAEELGFFPAIKTLNALEFGQDTLSIQLLKEFNLSWPPIALYAASNSSMVGINLAFEAIKGGCVDIAVVVGFMQVRSQDVVFMAGQAIMGDVPAQPFGKSPSVCWPANGLAAMIFQADTKKTERSLPVYAKLLQVTHTQSGGIRGGNAFTADFRTIAQTIITSLESANLTPQDIECCFIHGNGVNSSDKAECMALEKVFGKQTLPILSYKGQIGYFVSCAGVIDIMFMADAIAQRKVLAMSSTLELDESLNMRIHTNCDPLELKKGYLLKLGVGLDGSVSVAIISSMTREPS